MMNFIPRAQNGKSVMELLIVLTVIIILVTIAVAQFGNAGVNLDRQNIAREFKVSLERARFDSVKRRAIDCDNMSRVTITSASSFSLLMDLNQNGTIETATEARVVDFADRSDVRIVGEDTSFPVTIRFDRRGSVSSGPCSAPVDDVPEVVFCNTPCTMTTANASNSNIIFVSPTGTASMMTGGTTVPTFSSPAVSNVNVNSQVNPLLAVWDIANSNAAPSPSVDPSVSPSVDPSVSPSVDPSVSPSVDPSASPTATPLACAYGQRESEGCVCHSPMWVRTNGKCQ